MSIIAILIQIIQAVGSDEVVKYANILFALIIIIWSTVFIEYWKRQQSDFSLIFGQQDFEQDEAVRPAFKGDYTRSTENDSLNEIYYSPIVRKIKVLMSIGISITIIIIVVVLVIIIFTFKVELINCSSPEAENPCTTFMNPALNSNTVPAALNSVQIGIFNAIYQNLGNYLIEYQNHKILSSYENSLIALIFQFQFFNLFNASFFIAFLGTGLFEPLKLCQYNPDPQIPPNCFIQLNSQISVIFISGLVKIIPKLIKPKVKQYVLEKTMKVDEKPIIHPFNKIDQFIEKQSLLDPYMMNAEADGTVGDYMELVVQFSFLTLFGLAFPTCYALAFINNTIEIQVDKYSLVNAFIRPLPAGACNIGTWLIILDVITFWAIFCNAGLIAYTSGYYSAPKGASQEVQDEYVGIIKFQNQKDNLIISAFAAERINVFVGLLITFMAVKYIFRFLIDDIPESVFTINNRHKVQVERIVKGFSKQSNNVYKNAPFNFNVGGVTYDHNLNDSQIYIQPQDRSRIPKEGKEVEENLI